MRLFYYIIVCTIGLMSFLGIGRMYEIENTIDPPYEKIFDDIDAKGDDVTDIGKRFKDVAVTEDKYTVVQYIMRAFRIDYIDESNGQTATYYAKEMLNWFLSIIGLIALIVLIYGFYKMFFAKDHEEGFTEAKKIVTNAIIAIIIISLAWFIIIRFFRIYGVAKGNIQ